MTAADGVFILILFYSLVLGARRGFFKEVVHALALVVGIWAAWLLRGPVGGWLAEVSGAPRLGAEAAAIVLVWVVVFLVVAVVGRLILKKVRGKGVDDRLDDGAEAIADAIAGDTTKGPVTLLTDPIASRRGIYYWSDKILGALLGLLKGTLTGYVLFGLIVYADRLGWESSFARSVEASAAASVYEDAIDPYLETFPEYRIVENVSEMKEVAEVIRAHPERVDLVERHPELAPVRDDPRVQALVDDPELQQAWAERDLRAILTNERVQTLLKDPALRERFAEVDWERVREDLERGQLGGTPPPEPAPPPPSPAPETPPEDDASPR